MLSAKSTRVSRGAKEDLASDFFKVELPDQHAARIRYDLIHHVRNAVKAEQGSVTGLLFGAALRDNRSGLTGTNCCPRKRSRGLGICRRLELTVSRKPDREISTTEPPGPWDSSAHRRRAFSI